MAKRRRTIGVRAAAATVVARVAGGASLDEALAEVLARCRPADHGLLRELGYGTLRWHPRLRGIVARMIEKPLRARDADIDALLLVGLYQLLHTRIPAHAAVAETVAATGELGKGWASGVVNGTLRGFERRRESLLAELDADPVTALAHPAWLLDRLRAAWPERWTQIAEANNLRPPLTLRADTTTAPLEAWRSRLAAAGHPATPVEGVPTALRLDTPAEVTALPGFAEGGLSVQDAAAQLAAPLLAPPPGGRVLDACAAPGGKTSHLLQAQPALAELVAIDRSAARLERVRENLARIGGKATLLAADAGDPAAWWDGVPFDCILLDAPCSGTGVIRRHPDIKLLRRSGDIDALAAEQRRLLAAAWTLLAPGGRLLYATCSVIPEENELQINDFLGDTAEAEALPISADWGLERGHGRQILPGESGMDGFYYALLRRAPHTAGAT